MEKKWVLKPTRAFSIAKGRTFLHVDLDAFFASVEQVKNPALKGKPVIVGGRNSRRGVVAAASYEAKPFGIKTGMPWTEARQKCPEAIFLPADFDSYTTYSHLVRKILEKMAPVVAPASVDECYLDLTGCERLYGSAWDAAAKIREEIWRRTGLSASIGMAASHSVAKIASQSAKPAGLLEVPAGSEGRFLSPLPVEMMPGIGPRLGESLQGMGIITLGQLAKIPTPILQHKFGVYGPLLLAKARGEDGWELEITEEVKSVGKEKTFETDLSDAADLRRELWQLVEIVGRELRQKQLCACVVRVKVRYANFSGDATSVTLKDPTNFDRVLFRYAEELLLSFLRKQESHCPHIRLIGFTAAKLIPPSPQFDLFRSPKQHRWEKVYSAVDWLRGRFGFRSVSLPY